MVATGLPVGGMEQWTGGQSSPAPRGASMASPQRLQDYSQIHFSPESCEKDSPGYYGEQAPGICQLDFVDEGHPEAV